MPLRDDAIAVVDHFKATLELNAEVEIPVLLKGIVAKLEGMLKSDPAAAKELQETDAAKGKLQTATKLAKGSDLQQGKAPVQATAAATENNKGQQFGRQTTAKAYRGEDQKREEPDEGEEGDDQTGYETAAEGEGDEGSESDDEYEDASEW